MNPKTLLVKTNGCELCDFPMSQFHHFFPETRGGEKTGSKTGINLCPNHHLMANILQIQIEKFCQQRGCGADELRPEDFTHLDKFFDKPFESRVLEFIMGFDWGQREHLVHIGVCYDRFD